MAVWQVDFYIAPRAAVVAGTGVMASAGTDADWWSGASFPVDYHRRLDRVAPRGDSPVPGTETWGALDGNRVDVSSLDGRVRSVLARVDVRRLDSQFGAALIAFTRSLGALLVRSDGWIAEPTIAAYAGALRSSSAWQFANDPAAFLESRSGSANEDE